MSKPKTKKVEHTIIHPNAEKIGAVALTAVSMLVAFEAIVHHGGDKRGYHEPSQNQMALTEVFARGETKGETARLPEEYDIGLQTPHIAGL